MTTDPPVIVVAAASAAAAQRLAQRADHPRDLGPARNPARAAEGWRRWAFPVTPPPAVAAPAAPRDQAALLAKVRKLLALAGNDGATEGEASNAAAAAQRLIEEHRLDSALLDAGEPDAPPPPDEPIVDHPDPLDATKKRVAWRGRLASGVAKANGCRIYWQGGKEIRVIGAPSRVASVRTLYAWLSREVERLGSEAARGQGRSYGHAWRVGCAERLGERLREAARVGQREASARAIGSGVALVRVETALARIEPVAEGARVDAWSKRHLKLVSGRRTSITSGSGYRAGQAAGDRIRLTGHAALGRGAAGRIGGGS